MRRFITTILLLGGLTLFADDITTKDGVTYTNVKVIRKTPLGIELLSSEKAYWVDYRDLPNDVAVKYGYDPDKLKKYETDLQNSDGCTLDDNAAPDFPPVDTSSSATTPDDTNTYIYDPAIAVPVSGNFSFVYWNGNYYAWNQWHDWYWHHHWVYHHDRYYPAPYYYKHGIWENGKYYPYNPHRLYSGNPDYHVPAHHCSGYHGGGGHHR